LPEVAVHHHRPEIRASTKLVAARMRRCSPIIPRAVVRRGGDRDPGAGRRVLGAEVGEAVISISASSFTSSALPGVVESVLTRT
jgi:hypothetical protein